MNFSLASAAPLQGPCTKPPGAYRRTGPLVRHAVRERPERGHINERPDLQVQSGLLWFSMVIAEVQRLVQSGLLWFSLVQHPGLSLMWPLVTLSLSSPSHCKAGEEHS